VSNPDAWRSTLPTPDPAGDDDGLAPNGGGGSDDGRGQGEAHKGDRAKDGGAGAIVRLRVVPDAALDRAGARLPMTDLGNAERFVLRHGHDLRFCAELGWFLWDGRRFQLLSEEKDKLPAKVMQMVFATVRAIKNEAVLVKQSGVREACPEHFDDAQREAHDAQMADRMDYLVDAKKGVHYSDKLAEWARTSEGAGRLNCIGLLAKSFAGISVAVTDFDRDRLAINCQNGTLRLVKANRKRTAAEIAAGKSEWHTVWALRLDKHDRADLITKITQVDYRPKAKSPVYDAFMAKVQPDDAMRRFLLQWGGLSLTGDISEQKMAFFYGQGRNGKGTWVEAVAHIAGDYAGSIEVESLLDNGKRRGDQASPDIARLPGVRFLRVSEPSVGAVLNEGLVKKVTGGDPVDARHLNKGVFTFLPEFLITMSGNNKPTIKDTSHGMWERMQLVPWNVIISKEDIDRALGEKLRAEGNGIFARLMEGLLDWASNGLIQPDAVKEATKDYRDASDGLGRFLRQCTVAGNDSRAAPFRVRKNELYDLFEAWAGQTGAFVLPSRSFTKAMEAKGFEWKTSNGDWWLNIRAAFAAQDVKEGRWTAVDDDDAVPSQGIDNSDLDDLPI
jgi:P4 family phage/plasmid primase-like protien